MIDLLLLIDCSFMIAYILDSPNNPVRYCHSHFTGKETEGLRETCTCPRSLRWVSWNWNPAMWFPHHVLFPWSQNSLKSKIYSIIIWSVWECRNHVSRPFINHLSPIHVCGIYFWWWSKVLGYFCVRNARPDLQYSAPNSQDIPNPILTRCYLIAICSFTIRTYS